MTSCQTLADAGQSDPLRLPIICARTDVSWCPASTSWTGLLPFPKHAAHLHTAHLTTYMSLRIFPSEAMASFPEQDHLLLEAIVLLHALSNGNA